MGKYKSVKGMKDLYGRELDYIKRVENSFKKFAKFYGFDELRTPILEKERLFKKGIGEETDLSKKQLFSFTSEKGTKVTLRPDGMVPLVRSYLEQGFDEKEDPSKFWYLGPFFRDEKPKEGTRKQFHQAGVGIVDSGGWISDVEIIQLFYKVLTDLGLEDIVIKVNSIGDERKRSYYVKKLRSYLEKHKDSLCAECKKRLKKNPLRVLSCKEEECQEIIRSGAPQFLDNLSKKSNRHFKDVLETMDKLELPYQMDPYLIRSSNYYSRTVFEIEDTSEEGQKQGVLAGGGRSNPLVENLGGEEETLSCGGALGVERVANILKERGRKTSKKEKCRVFIAQVGKNAKREAVVLREKFRKYNIDASTVLTKDSLSSQLELAKQMEARYTVIIAYKELKEGETIIKNMKDDSQKKVPLDQVVTRVKGRLKRCK